MSAPRYSPLPAVEPVRAYSSPDHVPDGWTPGRPAEIVGRQPAGSRLGYQGPDQGYVIGLFERSRDRVRVQSGEKVDDVLVGCRGLALRRASLFGRAPVMHDVTLALAVWGFLLENPPADLVETRRPLFAGAAHPHHHGQVRDIADMVPESTLRMTPEQVASRAAGAWRALTGLVS